MGSALEKNSAAVRKRIEAHNFTDEGGEEYEPSAFGGFGDYFRRKKIKLQNLDAELRASGAAGAGAEKPQIFKGIVVHVSGYTQPPLHVLHRELVQHGAGFLQYLDSKTMATHIVASSLPPKKSVDFGRYRIVKPAWVTDSIAAGRLLPWSDYRVIDEGPRQKTIAFDGGKMLSQATQQSQAGYREQTDNSFYMSQFRKSEGQQLNSPGAAQRYQSHEDLEKEQKTAGGASGEDGAASAPDAMDVELEEDGGALAGATAGASEGAGTDPEDEGTSAQALTAAVEAATPIEGQARPRERQTPAEMTSEEHNAWLLSDPHIRKASSANPEFLKQFYSESRLHHLSTWKSELKSQMQKMANERGGPALKTIKRKPGTRRYIMHVDFDSFFCAVSLKKTPEYADRPAVVAHGTGSGSEIASCNYPARKFGVKNGMWMKKALELCPDLKILQYDFPGYEEASRLFYEAILDVGGVVQSVSVDEALVDVTSAVLTAASSNGLGLSEGSIWREQEKANEMATHLRERIKQKTGCDVSVGIGGNILLAKVALRKAKPAGQFQMVPEQVMDTLGDLKVEELPGVAWSIGGKLEAIGVRLVKDIRQTSKERLIATLGPKTGEKLWAYARGIDQTEVGEQSTRKSVSAEVNWGIRFISQQEAEEFVHNLCRELERRLLNESVKGKHLTMKIMRRSLDAPLDPAKHLGHGKCDTFNKSVVFGVATHSAEAVAREAVAILRSFRFSPGDLRGLGVQLTKLEPIKAATAGTAAAAAAAGGVEGSQRRLSFGAGKLGKPEAIEEDDDGSPFKARRPTAAKPDAVEDPIADDPMAPRKLKTHPALALARAGEADSKAQSPLNIQGTQFVLPPNPDPAVVAQLPKDIRSRLMAQATREPLMQSRGAASPSVHSRDQSPALSEDIPQDIDPEVFHALPDDMKAEVLASYHRRGAAGVGRPQTVLAASPRNDRTVQSKGLHKPPTPSKRGIRGMFNRAKERAHDAEAHLLQTNLLPMPRAQQQQQQHSGAEEDAATTSGDDEPDPEFLAELPEDMRREVVADHRRRRLAKRSGLNLEVSHHLHRRGGALGGGYDAADDDDNATALPGGQTRLAFPAAPPKVQFNRAALASEQELRDMLVAWREGTRGDGPHVADVDVFARYLGRVVLEERDMAKVRNLVRWLAWDVGEEADGPGKEAWKDAVGRIKEGVQAATRKRGLGAMVLD